MQTVPTNAASDSRARQLITEAFAGTPGRMRIYGAVAVAACLVFGVVGFVLVLHLDNRLGAERAHAAQLVRIQTIRTSVVKADANATNAFLVGGLEPAAARAAYSDAISTAAATIAAASSAEPSDSPALQNVNKELAIYTGLVESARANNRQGFPIGAAYLRQASKSIEDDVLPPLEQLADNERARVNDAAGATPDADLIGALVAFVVICLVVTQVWLYRRTRRVLNRPLLAATAVVIAFGLLGIVLATFADGAATDARDGPYAATVALATARINGFDAKSAESLTLIAQGSGQAYEDRFKVVTANASTALGNLTIAQIGPGEAATASSFHQYVSAHQRVRADDDGGRFEAAVKSATGSGEANRAFAAFEATSARALDARAKQLADNLGHARRALLVLSWILLLAGVAAAFLARRGIAQRLREYR